MIAPDTIALVRERTDLVALVGESVRLQKRGASFVGLCPFHKEKTGSFHVNPSRGFFHCFGCKESGSAVDFAMKHLGMSFPEAVRYLAERAGIEVRETATESEKREAQAARKDKEDLYALNHLAALFFERSMRDAADGGHPFSHLARAELARRGLVPEVQHEGEGALGPIAQVLQAFRIGYAPCAWDGLVSFLRKQGGAGAVTAAEKLGLVSPRNTGDGHYDRFRHRLMFAVMDVLGRVVAFSGRALPDPTEDEIAQAGLTGRVPLSRAGEPPAKYINSPESPIYSKGDNVFGLHQARAAMREAGEALLVEGNFDVVSLHARGIGNAVAPLGTAFTPQQAKLVKRFAPNVTILFDGDGAGRKATRAARVPCREAGLVAKVARMPPGQDPDAFVKDRGPEALRALTAQSRGLLEYLIDEALEPQGFNAANAVERSARVKAVMHLLREENDPNLRTMAKLYADHAAKKLSLLGINAEDHRSLERMVEQALAQPEPVRSEAPEPDGLEFGGGDPEAGGYEPSPFAFEGIEPGATRKSAASPEDRLATAIFGALLDHPDLLRDQDVEEALEVVEGTVVLAINALRRNADRVKSLAADEFLAQIPRPIHSFAAGRLAAPVFEASDEARAELLSNSRKLKRLRLRRENSTVVQELARGDTLGDATSEEALLRAVAKRARERSGLGS